MDKTVFIGGVVLLLVFFLVGVIVRLAALP